MRTQSHIVMERILSQSIIVLKVHQGASNHMCGLKETDDSKNMGGYCTIGLCVPSERGFISGAYVDPPPSYFLNVQQN